MPIQRYGKSRNPGGRPGKWKLGKTKMIRVPTVIADDLLAVARIVDKRGSEVLNQNLERLRCIGYTVKTSCDSKTSPGCSESSESTAA